MKTEERKSNSDSSPVAVENNLPPLLVNLIRERATGYVSGEATSQDDLKTGSAKGQHERGEFFDAINIDEALQLYRAVRELRPTATAEIGFCCAGSGMSILKALADNGEGKHFACDPYQSTYAKNAGLRNVAAAGLSDRLQFFEAFPESVVPGFPEVQFAFIDASHLFDFSILDFILIDKRLEVGGVVAFHDLWMTSLQKLTRYILSNRHYSIWNPANSRSVPSIPKLTLKNGIASICRMLPSADRIFTQELLHPWSEFGIGNVVMLRKNSKDDRDWRHFARF